MAYYEIRCIFERCPCSKKIILASRSEIISHFKHHDYIELLEQCVRFGLIKNKFERRSPQWLAENLLDYCKGEVEKK